MKLWTCTSCGAVERLHTIPTGCSVCGGQMETQDDRLVIGFCEGAVRYAAFTPVESWAKQAIADFEAEMAADDLAAAIGLWQSGKDLTDAQQSVLDDALTANRVGLILRVYEKAA